MKSVNLKVPKYNFKSIEKKWQKQWEENKTNQVDLEKAENPFYNLMMFPYPSAEGLHVGNMYAFTGADVYGRFKRLQGYDVFEPIGLDGFGIHSENYAIKIGEHIKEVSKRSEKRFYEQLSLVGNMYDWSRTVETYKPNYYKWTQWLFLKMFEKGLAYQKKAKVNWCPSCKTVLSDEQVMQGLCERCDSQVEKKELKQWFFKITEYADRLLENSQKEDFDWPSDVKLNQQNWIGRSEGAQIKFQIQNYKNQINSKSQNSNSEPPHSPLLGKEGKQGRLNEFLEVFTTRPDTLFGATYMVLAPEHEIVENYKSQITNYDEVSAYVEKAKNKSEQERKEEEKDLPAPRPGSYFVYAILCDDDSIYVGQTEDLKKRWKQHFSGTGARHTKTHKPERVIHYEEFYSRKDAIKREKDLKTGFGRKWLKREFKAGRTRQAGKTGVELKGIKVINPATKEEIPVWVADYVLAGYGTGAIMAVPAHDERDFEFAKKFGLKIKDVVVPYIKDKPREDKETEERDVVVGVVKNPKTNQYLCLKWSKTDWQSFPSGGVDGDEIVEAGKREIEEETGYTDLEFKKELGSPIFAEFYRPHKGSNVIAKFRYLLFELKGDEKVEVDEKELKTHKPLWIDEDKVESFINVSNQKIVWERLTQGEKAFSGEGVNINSDFLDSLKTLEAKKKMIEWLEKNKVGKKAVDYKLRDWCVSRQRYWGPPIPIIHCDKCGTVPVPEEDLPVELPPMDDFLPEGKGNGPLAKNEEFVKVKCPKCGADAERETDVSDPFVDSSWYFFRYPSTEFNDKAFDKELTKKWLPVDSYIGGKEHTVLHLLYSRFVTMVLHDLDYIDFDEPYKRFFGHGLITKDGAKMSKSKGNVVNPDEMIEKYGADTVRLYLRFLGDFSQGGDWRDSGAEGIFKFVKRLWDLFFELGKANGSGVEKTNMIDKTIKVVGEDLEKLSFNTAVARIMELVNWTKENISNISQDQARKIQETLAMVIAPMMPHIAEEFWNQLGNEDSIFNAKWPKFDENNILDDEIELVIQVNGKVRDKIQCDRDISKEDAEKLALESEKIKGYTEEKEIVKVIYVAGKLVNIVTS
ncbi:MAG: class I tRNA ligase family protein [Patescibacteria group bacterium]|jgi:leucyl-tRNA synthetase|nr:class I tRNA ligase family protein [Patescibacteria group bacterium]